MSPTPPPSGPTPESLFADWLVRHEAGEEPQVEVLWSDHPELEPRMRQLHALWARLEDLRQQAGLRGTLTERLRSRYGDGVDPQVTLEAADPPAAASASSQVLARLAGRRPASTRYQLQGDVARGGMGAILRVWDEDLRRHLAMKVMLGGAPSASSDGTPPVDPRLLSRFLEEAQVTGQLDHPGIVPVHELGLDAEGRAYFTMKLVRGQTLKDVFEALTRGDPDWTQTRVLGLVLRVCEAMSYAHAKQVIHRDLKPANVMVGRFGEVYVMDWGLAKVLGREDGKDIRIRSEPALATSVVRPERHAQAGETPDSPLYTMDGDVVGTPAYMPPEQAAGRLEEMGPHSDVYALGAMLYHLLCGHMPYVPTGARLNNYAVWQRVQEGAPRAVIDEAPGAPAELVAICEQAMARDPRARYRDMTALAADLSAFLEGRVVRAYETGAWAEGRKWIRRNKPLAAALASAVLAIVLGGVAFAFKAREATSAAALAQANEREATAQRDLVLGLADVQRLAELLQEVDELWPAHPQLRPALEDWLGRASELVARRPIHQQHLESVRRGLEELPQARPAPAVGSAAAHARSGLEARWLDLTLTGLLRGLEELEVGLLAEDAATPEHGWSVPRRLRLASELAAGFDQDGAYARAWNEALPALRSAYPWQELEPMMGLLPLGPDPESGLWEFAHLMSGTPARRGADGRLALAEESGIVLVLLPGGSFWMGAQAQDPGGRNYDPRAIPEEGPVHEVELTAFLVSKYELTQAQWLRMTGSNPSVYQGGRLATTPLSPVEQVSWLDGMTWLPRAGLTLPSEAQWEYAARGGTDTPWWTGEQRESLQDLQAANLADQAAARGGASWPDIQEWPELDDGYAVHAPVGSFAANPFGLHDVAGNLWEWCLDGHETLFYGRSPRADPVAPWEGRSHRVTRGGAFDYGAIHARSAFRNGDTVSDAGTNLGLRPARALAP